MIRLIYNNKAFKILNYFDITNSSKDVTFNDITIDFTGYTFEDIPLKYQEIQIKECADNENILTQGQVIFFGYVNEIKFGKMKMANEDRELIVTLLSPRKLATLRSITMTGTYKLAEAIPLIFEPLVNDGFVISEINVPDSQMLMNYISQTIENVMNDIGKKRNIFWTIDENKNIKVNSISYLFGQNIAKTINNEEGIEGLLDIVPETETTDYANIINIKNARLIYDYSAVYANNALTEVGDFPILDLPITIKQGDIVEFNYPVVISKDVGKQLLEEWQDPYRTSIGLLTIYADLHKFYMSSYYKSTNNIEVVNTLEIELIYDTFFKNLVTGFKYNGSSEVTLTEVHTKNALRYVMMKLVFSQEINKLRNIVSETGQIEKNVDANERWFTLPELASYGKSFLVDYTNKINKITLEYDINKEFKIGDLVEINLPAFYVKGKFAVTQIQYRYDSKLDQTWKITLQNSDVMSSFIDIFRPEQKQETEIQEYGLVITEFIEEGINETHTIEEVQDED